MHCTKRFFSEFSTAFFRVFRFLVSRVSLSAGNNGKEREFWGWTDLKFESRTRTLIRRSLLLLYQLKKSGDIVPSKYKC